MLKSLLLAGALTMLAVPAFASSTAVLQTTTKAAANPGLNADVTSTIAIQDRTLFDADNNGVVTRNEFSARMPQIDKNGNGRIEAMERANFVNSMPGNINTRGAAAAQAQADAGGRPTANAATNAQADYDSVRPSAEAAIGARNNVVTTTRSTTNAVLPGEAEARIRANASAYPSSNVNAAYNGGGVAVHSATVTNTNGLSTTTVNSNLNTIAPAASVNAGLGIGLNR